MSTSQQPLLLGELQQQHQQQQQSEPEQQQPQQQEQQPQQRQQQLQQPEQELQQQAQQSQQQEQQLPQQEQQPQHQERHLQQQEQHLQQQEQQLQQQHVGQRQQPVHHVQHEQLQQEVGSTSLPPTVDELQQQQLLVLSDGASVHPPLPGGPSAQQQQQVSAAAQQQQRRAGPAQQQRVGSLQIQQQRRGSPHQQQRVGLQQLQQRHQHRASIKQQNPRGGHAQQRRLPHALRGALQHQRQQHRGVQPPPQQLRKTVGPVQVLQQQQQPWRVMQQQQQEHQRQPDGEAADGRGGENSVVLAVNQWVAASLEGGPLHLARIVGVRRLRAAAAAAGVGGADHLPAVAAARPAEPRGAASAASARRAACLRGSSRGREDAALFPAVCAACRCNSSSSLPCSSITAGRGSSAGSCGGGTEGSPSNRGRSSVFFRCRVCGKEVKEDEEAAAQSENAAAVLPAETGSAAAAAPPAPMSSSSSSSSDGRPTPGGGRGTTLQQMPAADPAEWEYYVHFKSTNRRMDCWLPFDALYPVAADGRPLLLPAAGDNVTHQGHGREEEQEEKKKQEEQDPSQQQQQRRAISTPPSAAGGVSRAATPTRRGRARLKTAVLATAAAADTVAAADATAASGSLGDAAAAAAVRAAVADEQRGHKRRRQDDAAADAEHEELSEMKKQLHLQQQDQQQQQQLPPATRPVAAAAAEQPRPKEESSAGAAAAREPVESSSGDRRLRAWGDGAARADAAADAEKATADTRAGGTAAAAAAAADAQPGVTAAAGAEDTGGGAAAAATAAAATARAMAAAAAEAGPWSAWRRRLERFSLFDPSLQFSDEDADPEEHEGMDKATLHAHEEATKIKTIRHIQIGGFLLKTWYFSPYPATAQHAETLFICEFCLSFFVHARELATHARRCVLKHPPGDEIYRDGKLSVFEVDGSVARVYSENLCFLAKLFLDHKTLQYDVEPFLFYVLTEVDRRGCHLIGYFSKEKVSLQGYNLACILTLPQHQRKGYGRFLIAFSYLLSRREKKRGGPERPLSDLGRVSYSAWWRACLLTQLQQHLRKEQKKISIDDLVRSTAIRAEDVQKTLEEIGVLRYVQGHHLLLLQPDLVETRLAQAGKDGLPVHAENLHFVSYYRTPPGPHEALPVLPSSAVSEQQLHEEGGPSCGRKK